MYVAQCGVHCYDQSKETGAMRAKADSEGHEGCEQRGIWMVQQLSRHASEGHSVDTPITWDCGVVPWTG